MDVYAHARSRLTPRGDSSSARLPAHLRGCIENQQGAGADRAVLFEGALSDDYFTARQCLYDEYRIV